MQVGVCAGGCVWLMCMRTNIQEHVNPVYFLFLSVVFKFFYFLLLLFYCYFIVKFYSSYCYYFEFYHCFSVVVVF